LTSPAAAEAAHAALKLKYLDGGYYGDDDWCSTKLRQTLEHKIAKCGVSCTQ
jgi:hypothetical protein